MMDLGSITPNALAQLCLSVNTAEVWEEFVRRFQPAIRLSVQRVARRYDAATPQFVEDMVQNVFLGVCMDDCRVLRGFVPREEDSIIGFLKMVAENRTKDELQAEHAEKRGGKMRRQEDDGLALDSLATDFGSMRSSERKMLHDEIDRELQRLVPSVLLERDRTIFWLYFDQGFTARDIGDVPGLKLSVKGVESSLRRSTSYVRQGLRLKKAPWKSGRKGFSGSDPVSGET